MSPELSSEPTTFPYRPIRALSILLEGTWIGLVLLDAFLFFRPQNLNPLQLILWLSLCSACLIPSLVLHFNYLKYSRGRILTLKADHLILSREGEVMTIPYPEIKRIEVHFWRWPGAPWRVFDYFILESSNSQRIVIPSHLLGYLSFAKHPIIQSALNQVNPPVTFIKRFPSIRAAT